MTGDKLVATTATLAVTERDRDAQRHLVGAHVATEATLHAQAEQVRLSNNNCLPLDFFAPLLTAGARRGRHHGAPRVAAAWQGAAPDRHGAAQRRRHGRLPGGVSRVHCCILRVGYCCIVVIVFKLHHLFCSFI